MPPRNDRDAYARKAAEAMRAAGLEPLEPWPGAGQGWRSRCTGCGAEVSPRSSYVQQTGRGCRYCGIARRASGQLIRNPKEIMQAAGFEPLEPYRNAQTPWRCRCLTCGDEVTPRLAFVKLGHGCRTCAAARRKAVLHERQTEAAIRTVRAAGLEPLEAYTSVRAPWQCECSRCGEIVNPSLVYVRARKQTSECMHPQDSDLERRRRVETAVADLRAGGLEPLADYPGADTPWRSQCRTCGKECTPTIGTIRTGGGCRHCGAMRRGAKKAVPEERAVADMRAGGFEPLDPYPGTDVAWRCRCLNCGAICAPRRSNVLAGKGCVSCNVGGGFDPNRPGLVYVITHDHLGAHKVGICGLTTDRLDRWARRGWRLVGTIEFDDGLDAMTVETAVLRWLRKDLGLPPAPVDGDGATETVDLFAMPGARLLAKVEQTADEVKQGTVPPATSARAARRRAAQTPAAA